MKTEAITSVMIYPHGIKIANVSKVDSPFCRVAKDANSHLVLKMFQVYIQHFNSEKSRLETKLLMFRENYCTVCSWDIRKNNLVRKCKIFR